MGWADDLGGALKKGARNIGGAADKVTDTLVDKEAWSRLPPGGKPMRRQDWANVALDSTMLIPGAGVAGGAARIAVRQAAKRGGQETAEQVARKATVDSLRSPANRAVRGKADDMMSRLTSKAGATGAGKATTKAKGPLDNQVGRLAAKQKAGVGKKVGFGQTKKGVLRSAALTGGANALTRAYDEGLLGGGKGGGKGGKGGGIELGQLEGSAGGYYIIGAGGDVSSGGAAATSADALAAYTAQGGSPDGAQVIHLGN